VTGDAVNTDTQGKQTGLTRLDPAGTNVGESDPFIDTGGGGESPVEAERVGLVPIGAGWGGGGGSSAMRCNLDGVEIGCGWVMQMMDIGAAARCPNDDCGPQRRELTTSDGQRIPILTNPFQSFSDGTQGYFLVGTHYVGDGIIFNSWWTGRGEEKAYFNTGGELPDARFFFSSPQSTASPIWLPGGPNDETKQHINKTIADLVANKECVDAFKSAGLNDPNKVLNAGYVLASRDSLRALGQNNSYGIEQKGRGLSGNWPAGRAAVTASGPDYISGGRRLTVFSSNNFTSFGAVIDFPFNQYLQESGTRLRAIDFLVLHELVHAAGAPDLGLHDAVDKHFGLSAGAYNKISDACMPIRKVPPPIF